MKCVPIVSDGVPETLEVLEVVVAKIRSGPVRNEQTHQAILDAAAELFAAHGYDKMTIEGIAHEAGVGKQTIYRWWGSKGDLVAECLTAGILLPDQLALPNSGDIRRDLEEWLTRLFDIISKPETEVVIRSLVSAAAENPRIGMRIRESLIGLESVTGRLEAGIGEGQNLYNGAPFDEIAEALVGAVILRALSRTPPTALDASHLVSAIIGPKPTS
ncbi:TetR/AcrR family transcriptional regulator [Ancrocorticia sp.]|uniref:TetR/AcrR family transcriptional regulator n=1 Tax=Ancrocorticia sp. TaxID=2593684 RepID=UPI003F8F6514